MKVVLIYARIYGEAFRQAFESIGGSLWTLLLPMGLLLLFQVLVGPIAALGIVGGILLALLLDAIFSCYLYFVGELVAHQKVSLEEFRKSVFAYFWSVMNLFFLFWIASMLLRFLGGAQAGFIFFILQLVALVALNAAPEVIYQRGTYGGTETIRRSFEFLQQNWIEWFIPNVPLLALCYVIYVASFWLHPFAAPLLGGAAFHVLMVFRGHLFRELAGTSHRQRMFRIRMGG